MGMKWAWFSAIAIILVFVGLVGGMGYWIFLQSDPPTPAPPASTVNAEMVTSLVKETSELRVHAATLQEHVRQLSVLKQAVLQQSLDACDLVALEVKDSCLKLKQRPGWTYK